jgi:hypothetical protein
MHPFISKTLMQLFTKPAFAIDRVEALGLTARRILAHNYFPPSYQNTLCRLYFGTTYWDRAPSRFITTVNFPLDEDRYNVLANAFANLCPLPVTADVARGMGEMLGPPPHHPSRRTRCGFVLGGDGGDGCTYFIIDYNQVRVLTESRRPDQV